MSPLWRETLKLLRSLHIYLTLAALLLMLFYGVTGLMLSHQDWFGLDRPRTSEATGRIPAAILGTPGRPETLDKLALVEYLRSHFRLRGAMRPLEIPPGVESFIVRFAAPGYEADADVFWGLVVEPPPTPPDDAAATQPAKGAEPPAAEPIPAAAPLPAMEEVPAAEPVPAAAPVPAETPVPVETPVADPAGQDLAEPADADSADPPLMRPGDVTVTVTSSGLAGLLTDLHKGEHVGRWWWLLIDASAILLLAAAITGLVLWLSLPQRRKLGLFFLIAGVLLCLGAYLLLVPR